MHKYNAKFEQHVVVIKILNYISFPSVTFLCGFVWNTKYNFSFVGGLV